MNSSQVTQSANNSVNSNPNNPHCLAVTNASMKSFADINQSVVNGVQALALIIAAIGVLTNGALLVVFLYHPFLRRGMQIFIVQLLVLHIALCGILLPDSMHLITKARQFYPELCSACFSHHSAMVVFISWQSWTDGLLAIHRFLAVCFPGRFSRSTGGRHVRVFLFCLCFLHGILISIPYWLGTTVWYRMNPLGLCVTGASSVAGWNLVIYNVNGPWVLMALGTVAVAVTWGSSCHVNRLLPQNRVERSHAVVASGVTLVERRRQRVSRMLAASFIFNFVCATPVLVIGLGFKPLFDQYPILPLVWRLGSAIQYTFIPVVMYAMNSDYQKLGAGLLNRLKSWIFTRKPAPTIQVNSNSCSTNCKLVPISAIQGGAHT